MLFALLDGKLQLNVCLFVLFVQDFCHNELAKLPRSTSSSGSSVHILSEWDAPPSNDPAACTVDHVLQLLQCLFAISMDTGNG